MTLMKSILLGSAAGILAVAGAQAADLPTKKAAPAEYVKICNVGGMAGFIIPGSDTCLKISGYNVAEFAAGNLGTQYNWVSNALEGKKLAPPLSLSARQAAGASGSTIGFDDRFNIDFDARQMTAYGVLRMYASVNIENSSGYEQLGTAAYIDQAYLQWAGITAGKAPGFFAFYGGGEGWWNLYSPDQQGYNEPDLLAYTATFGGGFSATIALQSSGPNSPDGGNGTNINYTNAGVANTTNFGMTAPDIVANIRVDQAWGAAQLSGVAHQVHVLSYTGAASENVWGWGINGGVKFNLPTFGPGDNIQAQASYTQNAMWFSGIPDTAWVGGPLQMNGNGLAPTVADAFFAVNPKTGASVWATPTAWSATMTMEHHFSPVFSLDPEIGVAGLNWSNSFGQLSNTTTSWLVGAVGHWDPVPLLDFSLEVIYMTSHQSVPGLYTAAANGGIGFPANSSGVESRFQITRSF